MRSLKINKKKTNGYQTSYEKNENNESYKSYKNKNKKKPLVAGFLDVEEEKKQ
jgi:hypothetical protein